TSAGTAQAPRRERASKSTMATPKAKNTSPTRRKSISTVTRFLFRPIVPVRARLASFGHHGCRSRSRHRGPMRSSHLESMDLQRRAIIASMSRIAILGASGGLGTHLITSALEHDFEVSALVRDPKKITRANYNLTLIKGDAGSGEDVQAAIEECRFVVSALGARKPVRSEERRVGMASGRSWGRGSGW